MSRIWTLIWLLMAVGGLVLMAVSYRDARDSSLPVDERIILFVAERPEATAEKGMPVAAYFFPPEELVETLVKTLGGRNSASGRAFLHNHQQKVILFPDFDQRFTANMLESGRLPEPGAKEVLAEPRTALPDQITVGDQALRIVGVLKKADSLHLDAFYAVDDPAAREMLDPDGKLLISGFLVSRAELDKAQDMQKLFPREQFTAVVGMQRMSRATFNNYVAGMMLFVLGGSALLIQGYLIGARGITNSWIGPPLVQISRYWKLFTLLHVVYFGIIGAGMLVIYEVPLIQDFLLGAVRGEIESKSGVLGVAGQAYGSGNIALAAVTTLVINFFAGSLLVITLPSVIVPGVGVFMALLRATLWGIVLAPAHMTLAGAMVFHSVTLLLEGEGYILATFFALLVPIYLFSPSEGENLRNRYLRALMMNIKGNILVFIVLAIAATYEAIEVILQMPR